MVSNILQFTEPLNKWGNNPWDQDPKVLHGPISFILAIHSQVTFHLDCLIKMLLF
jgi:hypothetical protein